MPDVPPDVAIRATIRPGSVYYFRHQDFRHSSDPHYFVVINIDPMNEEVILLVCASSSIFKVTSRSANLPPQTLIRVEPSEYPGFVYASVFDCNYVYRDSLETLIERLSNKQLELKPEIDMKLVERLRRGVLDSPLVAGRIKAQLKALQSGQG